MNEVLVVRFADSARPAVADAQRLARHLGLLVLAVGPGKLVLMNNGMPNDMHLELRARRLAERLRQKALEVRPETARERKLRRDAADRRGQVTMP